MLAKLGELAAFHGFGDRPLERAVPPPRSVPPSASLLLPDGLEPAGTLTAAFSRDGRELVAVSLSGDILRWDVAAGTLVKRVALGERVNLASLSPELDRVAARVTDGALVISDAVTGTPVVSLGEGAFSVVAWSLDGKRVATGSRTGDVAVWDAATGRTLTTWWAHPAPVQALCFEVEGGQVATAGADGRISLWAVDTGRRTLRIVEPENHPLGVSAATRAGSPRTLTFTGGGAYLMAGLTGGGILLWDRESGHRLWTPPTHASPVRCVRAVHGDQSLVTAGQDGAVALWDAITGEPMCLLAGHSAAAVTLAVTPDGTRLASGGADPWLLLWDLPARSRDLNDAAARRAIALHARRVLERLGGTSD